MARSTTSPARHGSAVPARSSTAPVVGMAATPDGQGYWLADTNGKVTAVGSAPALGSASGVGNVVAIAATPSGKGYWLATATGHVLPFGDAGAYGSMAGVPLNQPVVGLAATPSGRRLLARGRRRRHLRLRRRAVPRLHRRTSGSTEPIVGMAATRSGAGYWMVAADGGIFAFGDAASTARPAPRALPARS